MVFIEQGLIILRDTTPDAAFPHKHSVLMQYWYRIHVEDLDFSHPAPPQGICKTLAQMKEHGLRWQSNLSMSYLQSLESMLVNQPERAAVVSLLDCHL